MTDRRDQCFAYNHRVALHLTTTIFPKPERTRASAYRALTSNTTETPTFHPQANSPKHQSTEAFNGYNKRAISAAKACWLIVLQNQMRGRRLVARPGPTAIRNLGFPSWTLRLTTTARTTTRTAPILSKHGPLVKQIIRSTCYRQRGNVPTLVSER